MSLEKYITNSERKMLGYLNSPDWRVDRCYLDKEAGGRFVSILILSRRNKDNPDKVEESIRVILPPREAESSIHKEVITE